MMEDNYVTRTAANAAIEAAELNLVATLKPRIFIDGDHWCVLYGENLQDGVAGFGKSPYLAALDFSKSWYAELKGSRHD